MSLGTRPRAFSIRRRILALACLLLLVAAAVLIVFINDYAERSADRAFDRLLAASALTIAGAVQVEDDGVIVELPFAAFSMFSGRDRVFYAVEDARGRLVTGYDDLATLRANVAGAGPYFDDIQYRGELMRVASVGRLASATNDASWVTIHVAETQSERGALSAEILGNAVVPVAALTVLAMLLVWFGIGRMFAPLTTLERELASRRSDDLAPLTVPVPNEVRQLVSTLNGFMTRLSSSMQRLSGLVAEAAHEVRTPLASLRAQAEVALDETDPEALKRRVGRMHALAVDASQLVSQLLMEATVSHRLEAQDFEETGLASALDEVTRQLDPEHLLRLQVDLGPTEDIVLPGDRVALRELLRNLVENALNYTSGQVWIRACRRDDGVEILVEDEGPGISDAEKGMVVERFRRGAAGAGRRGSGLGLSIVRQVIEASKGRFDLLDRPGGGLQVRVLLPVPQAAPGRAHRVGAGMAMLLVATLLILGTGERAEAATTYPAPGPEARLLTIVGATDTAVFSSFIRAFQVENPDVTVVYEEEETRPMYEKFLAGTLAVAPDLLVSSATDLQVKLANDGYALAYDSPYLQDLPAWAHWRNEVFGFSFEPAVIIYNPDLIGADEVPRTHLALAELLEHQGARFAGRVATYDIAISGVGHMLASQDQLISSNFWRLATAFGRVSAQFSGSSPGILNGVADGSLSLGYNVLGSYAFKRQSEGANIRIVVPDDYVLVFSRAMLIPRSSKEQDLARAFIDFALSPAGQSVAAGEAGLGSVVPGATGPWTSEAISAMGRGVTQPIAMGPALLVALDAQRRTRFLETWAGIVTPHVN